MERATADLRERLQAALGGAYALERELAGGGMARVFVATETALGRRVVVKVLPPELAHEVSAERFRREVQLAAQLRHPLVVPVLAAGEAGGLLHYTMPYVEGESLRTRLAREGALPVPAAVRVLRDVLEAVAHAHRRGVVHRDVKPENVLLDADSGHALVADFGVAKALAAARTAAGDDGANPSRDATLTQLGTALGTPAYMAPEQAAGEAVDARADLYAWGVVAYEALAGAHPFARHATPRALLTAHLSEAPAPLAGRAPTVPPPLAALVTRCLAKDPAERPASAEAVLHASTPSMLRTTGARAAPNCPSGAGYQDAGLRPPPWRCSCWPSVGWRSPSARAWRTRLRRLTGRPSLRSRSCRSRTWAATRRSSTSPTA